MHKILTIILLSVLTLFLLQKISTATSISLIQTKSKIQQLEKQIQNLKKNLANAHDIHSVLDKELAQTEKKMSGSISKLRILQQNITTKQQGIAKLKNQEIELNTQLDNQQRLLADHIRTCYTLGEYQPLKWILNQDDPYAVNRLLTFYHYLVQSRQHIIDTISATKDKITLNQQQLQIELSEQRTLESHLNHFQKKLEQNKSYHTAVLRSLNQEIKTKERTLEEFQRNKANLAHLLNTFISESQIYHPKRLFAAARHKLPLPTVGSRQAIKRMNQGVTIFAKEGAPVKAVYPGKIVFSDWLNGYGLLLIIDHGQGFMTLYAHNQSLFKAKGSLVQQGEIIAAVGHSGGIKQTGLYFEIRQGGKVISPLDWFA